MNDNIFNQGTTSKSGNTFSGLGNYGGVDGWSDMWDTVKEGASTIFDANVDNVVAEQTEKFNEPPPSPPADIILAPVAEPTGFMGAIKKNPALLVGGGILLLKVIAMAK